MTEAASDSIRPPAARPQQIQLESSWKSRVGALLESPKLRELAQFLRDQKAAGKRIYPPGDEIFAALNRTPFDTVKVVILGQDPYHGPGQAHGLCFSVRPGIAIPPSLRNIYAEIERDTGSAAIAGDLPDHGCLLSWADQGVLLLNAVLTVEDGKPGSHANRGWESFTDTIVECLARERQGLVFMLWGAYAQKKGAMIDRRHCVLRTTHPSPLSAHRGFIGCGHFSAANRWLVGQGQTPIDWRIPPAASTGT